MFKPPFNDYGTYTVFPKKEVDMYEIDSFTLENGDTIGLYSGDDSQYSIICMDDSGLIKWEREINNLEEATRYFEARREVA